MASIQKRNNNWRVQIRKKGQRALHATFDTRAEAEAWATAVEAAASPSTLPIPDDPDHLTVTEALERFETQVLHNLRSRGWPSHVKRLKRELGNLTLAGVTPRILAEYRDAQLAAGLNPQTVHHDLAFVSRLFNTAIKDWFMELPLGNPVTGIRKPKLPSGRERRLLPGEEAALLKGAAEYSGTIGPIIRFALATAMRRGEIVDMRWEHVSSNGKQLLIPATKNGSPRHIPLTRIARETLVSIQPRPAGRVWHMTPDAITRAFTRVRNRATKDCPTLRTLRFHDLRHEATSRLFEAGLEIPQAASITGHKEWKMLARYTHLRPDDLLETLDSFEALRRVRAGC